MQYRKITKEAFNDLVNNRISSGDGEVVGVVKKGTRFAFDTLESADQLCLDYDVTILPPKKYLLPPVDSILSFTPKDPASYEITVKAAPRVIIGVHPYDLAAVKLIDTAYIEDKQDTHYAERRKKITFIGMYPTREFKYRFASSADNPPPSETADAMLCDLGDCYGVELYTDKGGDFFGDALEDEEGIEERINKAKTKAGDGQKLPLAATEVTGLLRENERSGVFEARAEKCYSCGSCVLVCPTCYCFDMREDLDLSLQKGRRLRVWDGCVLEDFAKVAGGHNFRRSKADRFKHRIFRKGVYLVEKFGTFGCVGCGRCADACTADIANPVEVLSDILKECEEQGKEIKVEPVSVKPRPTSKEVPGVQKDPLLPVPAEIIRKEKMTALETLFEFKLADGSSLGHKPGQFVEISVPGIGECPISVSSSPTKTESFEMVIRKVGAVTSAIHALEVGDTVGIRGPFGTYFPVEELKGKDLLFVAGGIGLVPARSAIKYVLEHREDYNNVCIMFGTRDPSQRLFVDELKEWASMENVEFLETVDEADEEWSGNVGVVTTLCHKVTTEINPETIYAIVVGPPVMYKFVIQSLHDMGITDDHIIVSLERHMKCGIGKCGHCQIHNLYVCQDGPVFMLSEIKHLSEAI